MVCVKCGYSDVKENKKNGYSFCNICSNFVPENIKEFNKYINEKIDWRILDIFRKYNCSRGVKQKNGMINKASKGLPVTRAPFGYSIIDGKLEGNLDSINVISIFRTFLNDKISLNSLSKKFGFSINGIKKILQNRTYLGEIKFDGQFHKANHKQIIDNETFYAVQRKLKSILKS